MSVADLPTAVRELVPGGVDGVVDAALVGVAAQEAVRNGAGVHTREDAAAAYREVAGGGLRGRLVLIP